MADKVLVLLLLIGIITLVDCKKCPENCNCGSESVFCSGATNPRFQVTRTVLHVYMENGKMANLTWILIYFPHLKSLGLQDMMLDCTQLSDIPSRIYLVTNSCGNGMYWD